MYGRLCGYVIIVLSFQLFCYSETWEVHCAAMSDLRHRILPPSFLSESPKESGFCLWLLHPEPYSRPKSRYLLPTLLVGMLPDATHVLIIDIHVTYSADRL